MKRNVKKERGIGTMTALLREMRRMILRIIECSQSERHCAVNYEKETAIVELKRAVSVWYGTFSFSDDLEYLFLDVVLPVRVRYSFRLAVIHYLASESKDWNAGTLRLRDDGTVTMHYAVNIGKMTEKAVRLWTLINATGVGDNEKNTLFHMALPCLVPDKLTLGKLLDDAEQKLIGIMDPLTDLAKGIPVEYDVREYLKFRECKMLAKDILDLKYEHDDPLPPPPFEEDVFPDDFSSREFHETSDEDDDDDDDDFVYNDDPDPFDQPFTGDPTDFGDLPWDGSGAP